ncbi:hypothetical protein K431DRAFT_291424 [Polychaeton citri CBS 116435]|uniref:Uncharacterized protein n=1 Tax=Polychaeton citri CBS 116435 TaxID=1314669 RepID=A0A9P4QH39_9PEZI|nr:hypothetical protein K431DRAFT_291424 [Polychaeton citri CBS 116435]
MSARDTRKPTPPGRKAYSTADKAIRKSGFWDYPPGAHPIIPKGGLDATNNGYWKLPPGGEPIMPEVDEKKKWRLPPGAPLPSSYDEPPDKRPRTPWKTTQFVPRSIVSNLGHSRDYATFDSPLTRHLHQRVVSKIDCLYAVTNQLARDDRQRHLEKLAVMLENAMDLLFEDDGNTKVSDPDLSSSDGEDEDAGLEFEDETYRIVDGKRVYGWQGQDDWRRKAHKREKEAEKKARKTGIRSNEDQLMTGKDKADKLCVE